jgi:fucose 4-O-acetylase-like acetyltransferase
MNRIKNNTIDTIKALLILCVILWHLMSGQNSFTKEAIYFLSVFTMPLFFGISGFLLKKELLSKTFAQLLNKYFYRLIIPFIFAYLIFSLLQRTIINPIYPWFHLWFIPAFLLYIIYLYIIEHFDLNKLIVFISLFTLTFFWLSFFKEGPTSEFLYYLGDKRFYYYFVFLFFGYVLRNYPEKFKISLWIVFTAFVLSALYLFVFNSNKLSTFLYSLNFLFFNLSFIFLTIYLAKHFTNIKIPIFSKLGAITLPIYLWHVLPLLLTWKLRDMYHINGLLYIGLFFILLAIFIYLILKTKETRFTKILITGEKL